MHENGSGTLVAATSHDLLLVGADVLRAAGVLHEVLGDDREGLSTQMPATNVVARGAR
jgi:hypothetical protein